MNYAIIENDSLSLRRIKSACEKLRPEWTLLFTSSSVEESVMNMERNPDLDLLICDIELNDGLVFSLFKRMKIECPVIFVTAFDEYTLDAFKIFSIDYLLKPIEVLELEKAFLKYERIEKRNSRLSLETIEKLKHVVESKKYLKRLLISINDRFETLSIEDVGCFISEGKYVFAVQRNGLKRITSFKSLNDLEPLLDPDIFFRVSRETIVTVSVIRKVTRWFKGRLNLHIECGGYESEILISSARRNDFLEWFGS